MSRRFAKVPREQWTKKQAYYAMDSYVRKKLQEFLVSDEFREQTNKFAIELFSQPTSNHPCGLESLFK